MSRRELEVSRSKFKNKETRKLLEIAALVNWSDTLNNICTELKLLTEAELGDKYIWLVGRNPAYFIQYQVDSYAIIKAYGRVLLVWKPKYIEYPAIVKLADFGEKPKLSR